MQQSPSQNNPSDSMISQPLPNYNFLNFSNPQSDESRSSQIPNNQQKPYPLRGTNLQTQNDEVNEAKMNSYKQRTKIMAKGDLSNRLAINPWSINDQLKQEIKQKQKHVQQKTQVIDVVKAQVQKLQAQQKQIEMKIKNQEWMENNVKNKFKLKLKQQSICYEDQNKTHTQAANLLKQNLKKRSNATLDKLLPYLKYSEQQNKERIQKIEDMNKKLEIQGKKYEEQTKNYSQMIQQRTQNSKRNLTNDLIEDQKRILLEYRKYNDRQSQDLYLNQKRLSINQYEE